MREGVDRSHGRGKERREENLQKKAVGLLMGCHSVYEHRQSSHAKMERDAYHVLLLLQILHYFGPGHHQRAHEHVLGRAIHVARARRSRQLHLRKGLALVRLVLILHLAFGPRHVGMRREGGGGGGNRDGGGGDGTVVIVQVGGLCIGVELEYVLGRIHGFSRVEGEVVEIVEERVRVVGKGIRGHGLYLAAEGGHMQAVGQWHHDGNK